MEPQPKPIELTVEQQFALKAFELQVMEMSLEQTQQFLINLHKHMVMKEVAYSNLLKHEWGV